MSSVVISGDTSGAITFAAPAVAGTNTITLPAGTGTVAVQGASTNIVSGTAVASTSGTSIDFTSIPSWVRRITVIFNQVSTNGSSDYLIQIGTSGGIQATSYTGSSSRIVTSAGSAYYTTGFGINSGTQASNYVCNGIMTLALLNSSTGLWCSSGTFGDSGGSGANTTVNGGSKTLSGTLDRVRLTTVNGTDTFDSGSINILYE
jgi:hypothetical protein